MSEPEPAHTIANQLIAVIAERRRRDGQRTTAPGAYGLPPSTSGDRHLTRTKPSAR